MLIPELGVEIPRGEVLYPCCGRDVWAVLRMFGGLARAIHFADPFLPPHASEPFQGPRASQGRIHEIPWIGNVVTCDEEVVSICLAGCRVVSHRKDGLLTLLHDVGHLAAFYYRGDSSWEGGSGQRWLEPVLRDLVVSRLLEGGLIVTDGSNGGMDLVRNRKAGDEISQRNRRLRCVAVDLPGRRAGQPMVAWQVTGGSGGSE